MIKTLGKNYFLLVLIFFCNVSFAAHIDLKWDLQSQSIIDYAQFFEDKTNNLSLTDITSPEIQRQFKPLTINQISQGVKKSAYWLKFSVRNPRDNGLTWVVYPETSHIDYMEIWTKTGVGDWQYKKLDDTTSFHNREINYRLLNTSFKLKSKEKTDVYIKLSNKDLDVMNIELYVADLSSLRELLAKEYLFFGIYYGLFIALIILIISIWGYTQPYQFKYYFYFLTYIASNILLWLSINGFAYQFIWPDNPWLNKHSFYILFLLVSIFSLLFSREILNTQHYLPRLDKLILTLICLFSATIALKLLGFHQLTVYMALFSLLTITVQPLIGWLRLTPDTPYLKYFILAWLPYSFSMFYISLSTLLGGTHHDKAAILILQFCILFECFMLIITTLAKMKYQSIQLTQLSLSDPLTNLGNRRRLENFIQALKVNPLSNHGYWVLLIDIDHFKSINDQFGHAVGDHVIKKLAELLKENCRSNDESIRWGGEEFILLLRAENATKAQTIAERIRTHFANKTIEVDGNKVACTISIGVEQLDFSKLDPLDSAIENADIALYQAKTNGRNQVVFFKANLNSV